MKNLKTISIEQLQEMYKLLQSDLRKEASKVLTIVYMELHSRMDRKEFMTWCESC